MVGNTKSVQTGGLARRYDRYCVLVNFMIILQVASTQSTPPTQFAMWLKFTDSSVACEGESFLDMPRVPLQGEYSEVIHLSGPNATNAQVSGGCYYKNPIKFLDNYLSFSTFFLFSTRQFNGSYGSKNFSEQAGQGQYLTFFIASPCDEPSSVATGECLGLLTQNKASPSPKRSQSLAVQFNLGQFPNVGICINNNESTKSRTYYSNDAPRVEEEYYFSASIEYDGPSDRLDVSWFNPDSECLTAAFSLGNTGINSLREVFQSNSSVGFFSQGGTQGTQGTQSSTYTFVPVWYFNANGSEPLTDGIYQYKHCPKTAAAWWKSVVKIVLPVLFAALVLSGFIAIRHQRKKSKSLVQENADLEKARERLISELKLLDFGAREFTHQQLKKATEGFKDEIGSGGFGTVFKGTLAGVGAVAVKEIKKTKQNVEDAKQLVAEVEVIGRLRHVNIVPLVGWCYDKGVMLLVYKFIENGDLGKHLFPKSATVCEKLAGFQRGELNVDSLHTNWVGILEWPTKFELGGRKTYSSFAKAEGRNINLSWEKRMKALRGVAAALVFLHEEFESDKTVIHRDIKPTNVMLDSAFNARLGDFGLARLSKRTAPSHQSEMLAGTYGYIAPEYNCGATAKTDVYSFGVLVLVVATGRKPLDRSIPGRQESRLIEWVRNLYDQGKSVEAGDTALCSGSDWSMQDEKEMEAALKVGLACCAYDEAHRPTMREALTALHAVSTILSAPLPRQFPAEVLMPFNLSRFGKSEGSLTSSYLNSAPHSTLLATPLPRQFPAEVPPPAHQCSVCEISVEDPISNHSDSVSLLTY